jgi:hypothetical protein
MKAPLKKKGDLLVDMLTKQQSVAVAMKTIEKYF